VLSQRVLTFRMNILDRIVEVKRREVSALPLVSDSASLLKERMGQRADQRDFESALRNPRKGSVALIAEIKKASPSAGVIRQDFDPVELAKVYQNHGASCISVLTDTDFFQGSLDYLRAIRDQVELPLLRKDFIIDERQIVEAVDYGADCILLIVAILDDSQLRRFLKLASGCGLAVLVEVHDEKELGRALDAGARIIGVNNRNLKTFKVDLATTERLFHDLRSGKHGENLILVSESGIHSKGEVQRLAACGADAVLIGASLMKEKDIGLKIDHLLS